MAALLRPLIELCLLRRGPQDLPYSPPAVALAIIALLAVQLGFAHLQALPETAWSARVLVTLILLLGVTPVLLERRKLASRLAQTLLAQAGTSVLFALAMMPIAMALLPWLGNEEPPAQVLPLSLAMIFLFFWKLRVEAAIWRQALDIPAGAAYLLTFSLMLAEAVLLFLLLPAPAAVPAAP